MSGITRAILTGGLVTMAGCAALEPVVDPFLPPAVKQTWTHLSNLLTGTESVEQVTKVESVEVTVLPGINDNWPVRVELVRVSEESLVEALLGMDSAEWLDEAGRRFRLAHPEAVFDDWEVSPGTTVGPFDVERPGRLGGVLFCGLRESAVPPARFVHEGDVRIVVDDSGCTLSTVEDRTWSLGPLRFGPPKSVPDEERGP